MIQGSARRLAAVCGLGALTLAGCTAPAPEEPVTLVVGSYIGFDSTQNRFLIGLESASDGSITVEDVPQYTASGTDVESIEDEPALARAVIDGEIDIAWLQTRTFPAIGIPGLGAVDAPFGLTTTSRQLDFIESGGETLAADALAGSGLTVLAMLPGLVRYPLGLDAPLRDPAEWAGHTVMYGYAPAETSTNAQTVLALGAAPVSAGLHLDEDMEAGLYDVVLAQVGEGDPGFVLTDVAVWSRVEVMVVNTATWEGLTTAQRDLVLGQVAALREERAVEPDLAPSIAELCARGVRIAVPTDEQRAAVRAAVEPVYDWLRDQPEERAMLELVESISAEWPEAAPLDVPEGCRF